MNCTIILDTNDTVCVPIGEDDLAAAVLKEMGFTLVESTTAPTDAQLARAGEQRVAYILAKFYDDEGLLIENTDRRLVREPW
ncbi:hypothetical protein ASE14_07845 [Agromyces sp. Root81]|uniref:hypothetical protein n=1 Tax=Agromyces sp. Root81 TaxID=1736601 RepID=UPI0006FA6BB0|nr:hypothetical protein [Agromyces sp. Root81]KRC60867.1 hypothetical protein ASE14_07845 [Agromyces sp. Root81]